MWVDVQRDLAQILSSRLYPILATDPGYRVMLRNAGLASIPERTDGRVDPGFAQAQSGWRSSVPMKTPLKIHSSVQQLPPAVRANLDSAARMCAQLAVMDVSALGALRERRAKAIVLDGPVSLYRMWDSSSDNRTRHWWFSENLFNLASSQSAAANQSTRDWLRDRLAVSFNFGSCDRISTLRFGAGTAVPAVEAWGLPMPQYSRITRNADGASSGEAGRDYWDKYDAIFQGEKTQYFLPFVPPDRIQDTVWS